MNIFSDIFPSDVFAGMFGDDGLTVAINFKSISSMTVNGKLLLIKSIEFKSNSLLSVSKLLILKKSIVFSSISKLNITGMIFKTSIIFKSISKFIIVLASIGEFLYTSITFRQQSSMNISDMKFKAHLIFKSISKGPIVNGLTFIKSVLFSEKSRLKFSGMILKTSNIIFKSISTLLIKKNFKYRSRLTGEIKNTGKITAEIRS